MLVMVHSVKQCSPRIAFGWRFSPSQFSLFSEHRLKRNIFGYDGSHVPLQAEFLPVYQQQLKDMIISQVDKEGPGRDRPLEDLKVVVNAGNGMGGFLADTLREVRKVYCLSVGPEG